jgi:hypothetical protein
VALARDVADARDDVVDEPRDDDRHRGLGQGRLLVHDGDLGRQFVGVVRADLGAEAVLQRRDEPSAVGVVLGVRRRDHHDVQVEAHEVAPDLHVALLEHVEQSHLDALGEVGQLVHREDAAVGLGHQPVGEGPGSSR